MRQKASVVPLVLLVILLAGGAFLIYNRKSIAHKFEQVRRYGVRAILSDPEAEQEARVVTPKPTATAAPAQGSLPSITTVTPAVTQTALPTAPPASVAANKLPVSGPREDAALVMVGSVLVGSTCLYYRAQKRRLEKASGSIHIL